MVRIRLMGTIRVETNPDFTAVAPTAAPSPKVGSWGPQGIPKPPADYSGEGMLTYYVSGSQPGNGDVGSSVTSDSSGNGASAAFVAYNDERVWVNRNALVGAFNCVSARNDCPTPTGGSVERYSTPQFRLTSGQTLRVEPAAAWLYATGPASVMIGDTATYTVKPVKATDPILPDSWLWQPKAGGAPLPVTCIGASTNAPTTCRYAPTSSGTMYVRARVVSSSFPIEQADVPTEVRYPDLTVDARPIRVIKGLPVLFRARFSPARTGM